MYNFHLYEEKEIKRILGKDYAWYNAGCPIKRKSDWLRLDELQEKLIKALKAGKLPPSKVVNKYEIPKFHVISDEMIGGMFCPADGKTYDSKSSYYKAVKSKGLEIVGNDPIKPSKPNVPDVNWERAVAESLQQLK